MRELMLLVDRPELLQKLRDHAVPAGGVNAMAAVFDQPQAEELVVRDDQGEAIGLRQVAFKGEEQPVQLSRPPGYGQHTEELLERVAGLTAQEVRELLDSGVAASASK